MRQLASGTSSLLRSDDAGKTWSEVAGFGVSLVHALVAHPTRPTR
ncbi:hypothetical protein [Amycolatopsis taiwanensis]|nr:hypothetical protein [Amycolatopsis taiwanensis]